MQFNENQLKSFKQILEKMYGGSNLFMPNQNLKTLKHLPMAKTIYIFRI